MYAIDFGLQALAAGRIGVPLGPAAGGGGACACPKPAVPYQVGPATARLNKNAPIVLVLNFIPASGLTRETKQSQERTAGHSHGSPPRSNGSKLACKTPYCPACWLLKLLWISLPVSVSEILLSWDRFKSFEPFLLR